MPDGISVAEYLFRRLREAGLNAVHGVPGDYNLRLLDYVVPAGLEWIGNCNELNAGYAADGYARIKGIGAIVTTFGVGELSAINAIAGAYAEMAPVVHIVGTPNQTDQANGAKLHHSLCRGMPDDFKMFAEMYEKVTVAQENLTDVSAAAAQIDRAIRECFFQSRPVYIRVPMDMVDAIIPGTPLARALDLTPAPSDPIVEDEVCNIIVDRIKNASNPFILVDAGTSRYGLSSQADELIKATGFPTATTPFGKGIVDETLSNFHGIYGTVGPNTYTSYVDSCDLIINIGPAHSNVNTYYFATVPRPEVTVAIDRNAIHIGNRVWNVSPQNVLRAVLDYLKENALGHLAPYPDLPDLCLALKYLPPVKSDSKLTQDIFWLRMSTFFHSGDIILTETGTASTGGRDFVLPKNTTLINSSIWLSIGYMLAATQGAALAQRHIARFNGPLSNGRTILFEGDGSFQMTAQELSTIIRQKLDVIIFIINNNGYTIERLIHGPQEPYNDVASWRYLEAPSFFGAKKSDTSYPVFTARAGTWAELDGILGRDELQTGKGLRIVELMMDVMDSNDTLRLMLEMYKSKE
ncbi:thiamine diphosphate-binding protein [Penicillium canariense]|uniref:Pyruvate decarboxylase n=1 Tax=Penicillium canariense TaxID=189055 RepID=A0A9W9LEE5_9EURO|nr:thiamine diphosphate-binding protein [Penicillium canariense]KAJ5152631.1 thiamine diphosphate-binding protein [Penicillium canariense]